MSDRTIRAEVARGACSVEEIAACTAAGTKCGRCRPEIAEIVEHEAKRHGLPVLRSGVAA